MTLLRVLVQVDVYDELYASPVQLESVEWGRGGLVLVTSLIKKKRCSFYSLLHAEIVPFSKSF